MTWIDLGEIELEPDWLYFPLPGNLFRFRFPQTSDTRLQIAFYEELDQERILFGSRVVSLNQLVAIAHLSHVYEANATGFAIKPLFGAIPPFNLEIQMSINNVGASYQPDPATTIAATIPDLAANVAEQLLAANPDRKFAAIVNNSLSDVTIILGEPTGAANGKGIILKGGGGSVTISANSDIWWKGAISAMSANAVAAGLLSVVEGS
ncbi:MAG: hypothetical protein VKJ46_16000 [Leptolyngbyaceae bacterium]|nr:hypothetical protein [Leptolyngbyaceae bacterium]